MLRESKQDKTVTARHRETTDREDEQSERCPVTGHIAIDPGRLRETSSQVKTGPTFIWSFMANNFIEPANGRKQMNENENSSCALPHHTDNWKTIAWKKVIQRVSRLQRRNDRREFTNTFLNFHYMSNCQGCETETMGQSKSPDVSGF
jgi:hypothetical protein